MIDLSALFGPGQVPPVTAGAPGQGAAIGGFPGLLSAAQGMGLPNMAPIAGDAVVVPGPVAAQVADLIAGAQAKLAAPDLSDAEIADVVAGLTEGLAALAAQHPDLAMRIAALVGGEIGGDAGVLINTEKAGGTAPSLPGVSVTETLRPASAPTPDMPPRLLAEAIAELQSILTGGMPGMVAPQRNGAQPAVAGSTGQGPAHPFAVVPANATPVTTVAPAGIATVDGPDQAGPEGTAVGTIGAKPAGDQPVPTAHLSAQRADLATSPALNALVSGIARQMGEAAQHAAQPMTALPDPIQPPMPPAAAPQGAAPAATASALHPTPHASPAMPEPREILGQLRQHPVEAGRIRVELRPDGLGVVEIDLAKDEAGKLRVTLRADTPGVLMALRAERDGLMAMLREQGHDVDDSAMSFADSHRQQNSPDRGTEPGPAWHDLVARPEADDTAPTPRTPRLRMAGGVDVQV